MGTLASTLITTCLDNLAKSGTSTSRSGVTNTAMGITWLNNACLALARKHDFKELQKTYSGATVASQKNYSTPTNTKKIYDVRIIDGTSSRKLIPIIQNRFDKVAPYPETDSTGRPTWYAESGEGIDLYPIPDIVYTMYIRICQSPTTITATTDTVSYNSDKDDLLVAAMTVEGFRHYQMHEDAALWDKAFKEKLKDAMLTDEAMPDYAPIARGFNSQRTTPTVGDPWNSPFVWRLV